jgi:hypothetical protein
MPQPMRRMHSGNCSADVRITQGDVGVDFQPDIAPGISRRVSAPRENDRPVSPERRRGGRAGPDLRSAHPAGAGSMLPNVRGVQRESAVAPAGG